MRRKSVSILAVAAIVFPMSILVGGFGCSSSDNVTIEYNAVGGDVSPSSEVIPAGSNVFLPLPTYSGYVFGGWYTKDGIKAGVAGVSYTVSETTTLYAQWMTSGNASYSEKYSYMAGYSRYYVDYEIQYYVNGYHYDTQIASAYFDNYSTAWAFSLTGGPNPTPYDEQVWIDGVNRWWVLAERDNYLVEIEDLGDEHTYIYYSSTGIFPGTELADDIMSFTVEGYSTRIVGTQGTAFIKTTPMDYDPGYRGGDDPIVVHESWWTTTYSGWVYGDPDVYTAHIVPSGIIYSCH